MKPLRRFAPAVPPFGTSVPPPPAGGVFPVRGALGKEISFSLNPMESAWKRIGLPKPLLSGEVSSSEATMTERFSGGKSMQRTEKNITRPMRSAGKPPAVSLLWSRAKRAESWHWTAPSFYPEGGGQPADRGTLTLADGTVLHVTDVHESEGVIWHTVDAPCPPGRARGRGCRIHRLGMAVR